MLLKRYSIPATALPMYMMGILLGFMPLFYSQAQDTLYWVDFREPGKSWSHAGDVYTTPEETTLNYSQGEGILVNVPTKTKPGTDLFSQEEYGDMDLELEFMLAKGSNSGLYLQGRYEIQLLDSWGVVNPGAGDNGGIYQRWDESRPEGKKGYQGHAPRQNVSRAPGIWQHLFVSFRAPRFDANGNKTENARILRVVLNGVLIHENVELLGPTRGGLDNNEKPKGPLRIQGDHGPVALRNIIVTAFDKPRPELSNLSYIIYKGNFEEEPELKDLPPEAQGSSEILTSFLAPMPDQFLIKFTGELFVKESGTYTFNLNVPGGYGKVMVDREEVLGFGPGYRKGSIALPVGKVPFELLYSKFMVWVETGLGLAVAGPGIREFQVTNSNIVESNIINPIFVDPKERFMLRSFMDIPDQPRVTHAISVGSEAMVHYSYDLDNGSLFQMWRGGFLDATPMWYSRGDGSSRPYGSVVLLDSPFLPVRHLSSRQELWPSDTLGSSYRQKGYRIDENKSLTFVSEVHGATVEDGISVLENFQGFKREFKFKNLPKDLYMLLARGKNIKEYKKGLYLIEDSAFFVELEAGAAKKAFLRNVSGDQELLVPVTESFSYKLLF